MPADRGPIIVGYDNSDASKAALAWAAEQSEGTSAEVVVVYVSSSLEEWELAAIQVDPDPIRRRFAGLLQDEWTAPLRARGVKYRTHVAIGRAPEELMNIARAEDASLIVIGMTGRGTLGELISHHTQGTLRHHAMRPVVAVPAAWVDRGAE